MCTQKVIIFFNTEQIFIQVRSHHGTCFQFHALIYCVNPSNWLVLNWYRIQAKIHWQRPCHNRLNFVHAYFKNTLYSFFLFFYISMQLYEVGVLWSNHLPRGGGWNLWVEKWTANALCSVNAYIGLHRWSISYLYKNPTSSLPIGETPIFKPTMNMIKFHFLILIQNSKNRCSFLSLKPTNSQQVTNVCCATFYVRLQIFFFKSYLYHFMLLRPASNET